MKKLSKKQRQKALFQDKLYHLLRLYQVGELRPTESVVAGKLDFTLTALMDGIVEAFDETQK